MKLTTINNNIVFVLTENVGGSLKTDPIEQKILSVYSDKLPKPVVSKFPDQITVFIPEAQISIFAASAMLMIGDQTIGDFSRKDLNKFFQLADFVLEDRKSSVRMYGYNFTYEVESEGGTFEDFGSKLKTKFAKENLSEEIISGSTLRYILPTISLTKGDSKILIKFEPVMDVDGKETNRLRIQINYHFGEPPSPLLPLELIDDYKSKEQIISQYVRTIFPA